MDYVEFIKIGYLQYRGLERQLLSSGGDVKNAREEEGWNLISNASQELDHLIVNATGLNDPLGRSVV